MNEEQMHFALIALLIVAAVVLAVTGNDTAAWIAATGALWALLGVF